LVLALLQAVDIMAQKGDKLMADASASLNKFRVFGNKYEEAVELYKQAANAYKLAKAWSEAGTAFLRQADCFTQMQNKFEAATAFQNAATCFEKCDLKRAIDAQKRSCEFYVNEGRFGMAAKQEEEIGNWYEKEGDLESALEHLRTAADYFDGEGQASAAAKLKLKIADHAATAEKYSVAIEIFEAVAVTYLENKLLKYSAKELLFKAGICHLCADDLISAKRAVEKYQDMDVTFANQRECKMLVKLIEAVEAFDADALTATVRDYISITPMDAWKTTLVNRVKNNILAQAGGGAGNEDMT